MSANVNPPSSSGSRSLLVLVVEQPGLPRQEFFVQHGLTIGRNPSNAICIDDAAIERIHALLQRRPDGSLILACQDENAAMIDQAGQAVRQLDLHDGIAFTIGPASLRCVAHKSRIVAPASQEPWEISCPRCAGDLTDLPPDTPRCPHCDLHIIHVQAGPVTGGEQTSEGGPPASGFNGWLPKVVGPYDIRAFVAQGGMGIVLRGMRRDTETPAAVKLLRGNLQADEISGQRFAAEVTVLSRLRHPNLVMLQDHGQDGKMLWLAMDWVDGQSLSVLLAGGAAAGQVLELRQVGTIMQQLCAGLSCLHEQGIIHRDLKPGNILVARDGLIKITDMGIAKTLINRSAVTAVTRTGSIVGTDAYMAPEQMEGQIATPTSDIYSLGVIWYELLAGRLPRGAFGTPSDSRPDCPGNWNDAVLACLSPASGSRPSLAAIIGVVSQPSAAGAGRTTAVFSRPSGGRKRGRAGWLVGTAVAATVLAAIVVASWFLWPPHREPAKIGSGQRQVATKLLGKKPAPSHPGTSGGGQVPPAHAPITQIVGVGQQRSSGHPAPSVPAAPVPQITSVTSTAASQYQRFVIKGKNFGTQPPFNGDSPVFQFSDMTRHWNAGNDRWPGLPTAGDWITANVTKWTNTEIDLSGFGGDYGMFGWLLIPGDKVEIAVWNAQTAQSEPASPAGPWRMVGWGGRVTRSPCAIADGTVGGGKFVFAQFKPPVIAPQAWSLRTHAPAPPAVDPQAINLTSYHQAVALELPDPRGVYYLKMPSGQYRIFASPGVDPVTHKKVNLVTDPIAKQIEHWFRTNPWPKGPAEIRFVSKRQGRRFNFFPHGGLWYDTGGRLGYRIFDGPGVDPHNGRKLKSLTARVVRRLRENIRSAIWSARPGN